MTTHGRASDPAQRDRTWFGYDPRALAPLAAAGALVSLLVWTGRWYQPHLSALAERAGALSVFAAVWAAWVGFGAVFLYRTVTYTYRLTSSALLVDFGFGHRPVAPVELVEVAGVSAGAGAFGRVLNVGWVEVRTAHRTVRLPGVRGPERMATRIRAAVAAAHATP